MNRPGTFTLLLSVMLIAGCASISEFKSPRVSVVGASMTSADVFSQQFRVRLHVENPNARALPVKRLEYKLFLEGDSFAEGESRVPFVVPANGQLDFDLPVNTHFVSAIGRLLSRLSGTDRHEIQYNFEGSVVVDMTFSPKLKFAEKGMVDLSRR